nr:RuBisCO long chain, Form III-b [uncultured archaeon]
MLEYIDLRYQPSNNDLICSFYVEPDNCSLEKAARNVALESSIGTWTEIEIDKHTKKLKPNVFSINRRTNEIKIAYPSELFEPGNIPQILSSVAGNIFGMKIVKNLRLNDVAFPYKIIKSFKGPEFGIEGIRNLLKIKSRPLVGTIIKPKLGLVTKKHADVAYEAWLGGCDIVKDDENLTNQKFNPFRERVIKTLEKRDKVQELTGEKKIYMPNITAETNEMIKRAEFVKEHGGEYIMVDILTVGWSALQTIRDLNLKLVIHAHRAMHAAITRNQKHGISMLTLAKISRLIGVDQLHIGTVVGKMEGTAEEVEEVEDEMENSMIHPVKPTHILEQRWYHIKPVFAVCSGGLHPGHIPELVKILGKNIIIQMGGGIHGHPSGTRIGAVAARQAVDAVMRRVPLSVFARDHYELKQALEHWLG